LETEEKRRGKKKKKKKAQQQKIQKLPIQIQPKNK